MAKPEMVVALHSFSGLLDGAEVQVQEGEIHTDDEPVVKSRPHMFGPITVSAVVTRTVEQATSAPGEQRGQPGKAITTARIKGRDN